MKITFLDTDTLGNSFQPEAFTCFGEVSFYPNTRPDQTLQRIQDRDIVVTNKVIISSELIDRCEQLKLICISATGTDNVAVAYAEQKGILVKNAVNYSTDSVAEFAFSLGLALNNRLKYYDRYARYDYENDQIFSHIGPGFRQVNGKRVGIIGLGNIGKKTASLYHALGAQISYYSISQTEQECDYQFYSDLSEFLSEQDIISIHCPLSEASRNLINKDSLQFMKSSSLVVNVSRGAVVNEEDLADALENRLIAGAAIDIYDQEPISKNSPYYRISELDNVILTPHIAWGSDESRTALVNIIKQHISDYIS
jgi:glycerate dehydrogenase